MSFVLETLGSKSGPYEGNGAATEFTITFAFLEAAQVKALLTRPGEDNVDLVLDTDYTVLGAGTEGGGTLTFPAGGSAYSTLAEGERLTIYRETSITQEVRWSNDGEADMEPIGDSDSKLTMIVQEQQEQIDRCPKYPRDRTPEEIGDLSEYLSEIQADAGAAASSAAEAVTAKNLAEAARDAAQAAAGSVNMPPSPTTNDMLVFGGAGWVTMTQAQVLSHIGAAAAGHNHDGTYAAVGHDHDSEYLAVDNADPFVPSGDYQPATKKYVDDAVAGAGNAPVIVTATRDMAAADGPVDYDGLGFTPSLVEVDYIVDGEDVLGYGVINNASPTPLEAARYTNSAGTGYVLNNDVFVGAFDGGGSNSVTGTAEIITDGVRITWAKSGSPTGTVKMFLKFHP